jgi:pimeloyl-ACP methyl ester carboxylesterase
VLEPQSTAFFVLLMVIFGALLVWLIMAKQVVFRVLAACLAFIPAMVFGIAAVNKYYDYYQTWGAAFNDLTGQSAQEIPKVTAAGLGAEHGLSAAMGMQSLAVDAQVGLLFQTTVTGPVSHITRSVYIYLPPQYFQRRYAHYRFPGILLLHGSPGQPDTWINVLGLIPTYQNLLATHKAAPAVLVMPDTDGGLRYGLQCLNDPGGLQDMTFVAREVPEYIEKNLRVSPEGSAWGVAGYSEGGFCAANIGLQNPTRFAMVGSLSGYFAPIKSQVPEGNKPGGRPHDINDFAGNPRLALINTPDKYILHIPPDVEIPQFFLAAGASDPGDVQAMLYFRQLLQFRQPGGPDIIVPGAGHQAKVWRAALGPMLTWMTIPLQAAAMEPAKPARRPVVVKGHHLPVKKTPAALRSTTPPARKP